MRNALTIAAVAALIALSPAAALAGTECQNAPKMGAGTSPDQAWAKWREVVTTAYGPAWASLELAQNRDVTSVTLPGLFTGPNTTYMASGVPCRTVRIGAGMANATGNLDMMDSNDAGPKAQGTFSKRKLMAKFN